MIRPLTRIAPLLALVVPLLAHAKPHRPKVMVLDLTADESLKKSTLSTLNAFLAGEVRDEGFEVLTPSQIGAVLGLERQKQLLGCTETSCLAEIGGALGVDFILQGNLALFEHDSALTLTLIDQRGSAISSQRRLVKGTDAENIVHVIQELVPKLMAAARPDQPPNLTKPPPTASSTPAGGLEGNQVTRSTSSGHPTGSYLLLGTGAALLVASAVTGLIASKDASSFKSDFPDGTKSAQALSEKNSAHTFALVSTATLGVGLACAVGGGIWWISDSGAEP